MAVVRTDVEKEKEALQRLMKTASNQILSLLQTLGTINALHLGVPVNYDGTDDPANLEYDAAGTLYALLQIKAAIESNVSSVAKGADTGGNIPNV